MFFSEARHSVGADTGCSQRLSSSCTSACRLERGPDAHLQTHKHQDVNDAFGITVIKSQGEVTRMHRIDMYTKCCLIDYIHMAAILLLCHAQGGKWVERNI